jgi:hypothetical protein
MKKSERPFLTTWLVLAVLLGLGAYVYFVERKQPAGDTKPKEKVFASLDKAKVTELDIAPREGEAVRLVKDGEAWKLTAPLTAPADANEADSLAGSLANLELDEVVAEDGAKLGEFGLDPPKATVGVKVEGASEPMKLLLGDKSPDGGSVYAKLPTQPRVFTIASYLEGSFTKKPFELRDRQVLHVKRDAVKSLEVAAPEGAFSLAKDDKGEWGFVKPVVTRAGRWSVDGLVGSLESLRMESVAAEEALDKDLARYGLAKPVRSVVIGLDGGASKTLQIGGSPDAPAPAEKAKGDSKGEPSPSPSPAKPTKYWAREAGSRLVAVIPSAIVDDLAKGMGEYRAKRLLDVATYEVEGFEAEAEGTKRSFARSTTKDKDGIEQHKWKQAAPDAKDLETNKVQDVLFKVGGVEVADFLDAPSGPEAYGLDKPILKVTLKMGEGKPESWFEVVVKDGAGYARRDGDQAILKLDAAKIEELVKAFKEL